MANGNCWKHILLFARAATCHGKGQTVGSILKLIWMGNALHGRRRATSILNEKVREGVGGGDRNKEKVDQLFVLSTHNMASQIVALFTKENCPIKIDNSLW
ncbi:unnamed protein product [Prunus armeniaca]|uniref:Uncharacterized protein n=1 Tax=Prunus armeniaca TaxID=36596 RepID=A0A6J5XIM2_PRUAR|nr:unnamed protein product [Prunus armeniaca]